MSGRDEVEGRIAVIGVSGRFPGADTLPEFWRNLCDGRESVEFFTDDELEDCFDRATRSAENFVKARPVLGGAELFDAAFFGMHPREAELTDPQHRIFLECAWEALEDAGYDPGTYHGAIGVFAGCSMNTYFLDNVCRDRRALEVFTSNFQVGSYSELLGAGREFLATRVSYKLDLRGPSMTIQTACSTSLVAVAQACQSLLLYQSDMALAGGVSISFPQRRGYLHQDGGMVSADGHCRPFDASASGTVFGSGAGVILLKRMADAIADGDHIYAVILGCGISNDGAGKVGFTAPSVAGQAAAIEQAMAQAGVKARTIEYVECHGTATPLGDPIEIAALTKAFCASTAERQYCAIGSVKGNIGHLDAAAGVTGLIKTALMLKNRRFVPTANFQAPNPYLDLPATPFFVETGHRDWPAAAWPRRAGVSSLGVGGTNAHVILEEPPAGCAVEDVPGWETLLVSARSPAALLRARSQLAAHLKSKPDQRLADIAFTLQFGRRHFAHRCAAVCRTHAEAATLFETAEQGAVVQGRSDDAATALAFTFPGQGSQFPDMARGVYANFPVFRRSFQQCADCLEPLGVNLVAAVFGTEQANRAAALARTGLAQPAIFSIEYALAQLWLSSGMKPTAFIGHSLGEFVAACLSGVFTLPDALELVTLRGRLMEALPAGGMLAVRCPESRLRPLLGSALSIAAINSPQLCVASGPLDAIADLERILVDENVSCRRLQTSHAFHSAMIDPVIAPLAEHVGRLTLGEPTIPWVSTVTGEWITAAQAASPGYWASHAREPVRFDAALRTLLRKGAPLLLETGPGTTLSVLAMQVANQHVNRIVSSLPGADQPEPDGESIFRAAAAVWANGIDIDWRVLAPGPRVRVSLPTYPFERRRCWIDPPRRDPAGLGPAEAERNVALIGTPGVADSGTKEQTMAELPIEGAEPGVPAADIDDAIVAGIRSILQDVSGELLADIPPSTTFLAMGFDSLLLTQVVQKIQTCFKVKVSFRQLLGPLATVPDLGRFLKERSPVASQPRSAQPAASPTPPAGEKSGSPELAAAVLPASSVSAADGDVVALMRSQIEAMSFTIQKQLEILQRPLPQTGDAEVADASVARSRAGVQSPVPDSPDPRPSRFRMYQPVQGAGAEELPPAQRGHIAQLVRRLEAKTAGSKRVTAQYRPVLADPRAASGFRAEWKELVYPIVSVRSHGSKIWDVDGNEYIDLVNGYGPTALGHAPNFITQALREQLDKGFATGPQAELAGEIALLFTEMTGNERMTFCNTGSEAVMAALRVARTVTARSKVVMFSGAYHGQFDEVLVRGGSWPDGSPRALPAATGIPQSAIENMIVLDYATPASLEWVRMHAEELAAVIVEPVQSRHPALRPIDFLRALREITEQAGTAFIMDEIVTGFRVHPGGMQAITGIRADLATYGKIIGGGMPIGILAGKAKFMDALDGGQWSYGDGSVPEVGVTFFAGTFVRHPLTLAAVRAVLLHLKAHGPALLEGVSSLAADLAQRLDVLFRRYGLSAEIEHYSSFLHFSLPADNPLLALLYYHLRDRGIHAQNGFPLFLTTAHMQDDIDRIVAAFEDSLRELSEAGICIPVAVEEASPAREEAAADQPSESVPLTESQLEIWLSAQRGDDESCAFNESITLRLQGDLDLATLNMALAQTVVRHDALRLRFSGTGEQMWAEPPDGFDLLVEDAAAGERQDGEAALAAYIQTDAQTPFDLTEKPPVRWRLFRLSSNFHALVLTAHHIVCDGWSMNVVISELAEIYAALREQRPPELGPVLPFIAYAGAQARRSAGEVEAAEAYWLGEFKSPIEPIDLPTDRPRGARRSSLGDTRSHWLGKPLYHAVKAAGAAEGCTLFVMLLAAFEVLMGRLADVEELVIAVPTAGQSLIEGRQLVGHCVNFLPIRGGWASNISTAEHLRAVSKQVLNAHEHQECTLGTIVRKLALFRRPNRLPLTEIQFNLERLADRIDAGGLVIRVVPNPKSRVNYDIFWNVIESPDGLRIDCDYNAHLFDRTTIDRWLQCYEAILDSLTRNRAVPITQLDWLSDVERDRLVSHFNATAAPYPSDQTVLDLIESQAARRPEAAAVKFRDRVFSFSEINIRADRLAQHIQAGIERSSGRIGVLLDRSDEMLVALLAVWKAGCAYVPLDPSHPAARLRAILGQADIMGVITDGARSDVLPGLDRPVIDVQGERGMITGRPALRLERNLHADSTAYVIFTSGSTGAPKGVEVSHRSVVNLFCSLAREPGLQDSDVLLAVTTIAFDIAALELFLPLTVGGTVVITESKDSLDGQKLLSTLKTHQATAVQATPATWYILLEAGFASWPGLTMLCGGEALSRNLADRLLEGGGVLWNMYGPTETTIWSSCCQITRENGPITVGGPVANTHFCIWDKHDQLVPTGVVGELLIGGDGVAKGYFRRDDLTAERFIADPRDSGVRLYRTGDLARWTNAGVVQILGRLDNQVKLRGFRIELGEIEAALLRCAGVTQAAVLLREDVGEHPALVAYVTGPEGTAALERQLRAALAEILPDYMIPSFWMHASELPRLPNGKLDRKALPRPQPRQSLADKFSPPETPMEEKLAEVWAHVMKLERIGRHDDLLELGADSIHLFQIAARSNRQGLQISARQLLDHRTVAELAAFVEGENSAVGESVTSAAISLQEFQRRKLAFSV